MEHASPVVAALFIIFAVVLLLNVARIRGGRAVSLRRIAGLEAIDEAIGRSTEQGRPLMFNNGWTDLSVDLFCSLAVMSHVIRRAATYSMPVMAPFAFPLSYAMGEEYWKAAYAAAGREGMFSPEENLRYFSDNQSAFGASIASWIKRDNVGANFMFGQYGYESLIIAEAGQQAGAMQIAATPSIFQVPFLMVSCDYTVFGEEFYVAGAYYSQDPQLLGSIVSQDQAKLVVLAAILLGVIMLALARTEWLSALLYW